jgi:hypothetical protein
MELFFFIQMKKLIIIASLHSDGCQAMQSS